MKQEFVEKIKHNPDYIKLVKIRTQYAIRLTITMLVIYFTFILTIAFKPSLLAQTISATSVITIGIPIGIFVILIAFVLTGLYTRRANSEFDDLSKKIKNSLVEKK
ncbi:Putative membrane protein, clustering with ActP [hydrothermal vent metagenome]|uniref:Putative membrane protein, clustering with ActP n=1 Tax=hydrothermal vent metagenome TaxID=652676 RepID=A0A1W1CN69_9ZZZZ